MRNLLWLGGAVLLLGCGWIGCSGSEVTNNSSMTGGSSGADAAAGGATGGSAGATGGSGGTAGATAYGGSGGTCQIDCGPPPPGCVFLGEPTCNPPKCPPMACDGGMDVTTDIGCHIECGVPPPGCSFQGEPTCNPPQCPPIVCLDSGPEASADAPVLDGSLPDAQTFVSLLEGVWLIGWTGGMNHYSWVRITGTPNWGGEAVYLAGKELLSNLPYWECNGVGSWMITAKPYTVGFNFPASCTVGFEALSFLSLEAATGGPPSATLHATLESSSGGMNVEGYRFPLDQCDATMTTCKDPWTK